MSEYKSTKQDFAIPLIIRLAEGKACLCAECLRQGQIKDGIFPFQIATPSAEVELDGLG